MKDSKVAKTENHVIFYEVTVDHKLLHNYHFTSNEIYYRIIDYNEINSGETKKGFIQNHNYSTAIEAESLDLAKQKFENKKEDFILNLKQFGLDNIYGEIIYLVNSVIEFECNLEGELFVNEYALNTLNFISKVLALHNQDGLSLNFRKTLDGKSKTLLTLDNNYQRIISATITDLAQTVFEEFKSEEHLLPSMIYSEVRSIEQITLSEVTLLKDKLISIPKQTNLESLTLSTVAKFLHNLLKHESHLKSDARLTNDQARIIYIICDYYGLINKPEHIMDREKIDYIKAILRNRSSIE